jgi:lysine-N-methylase
VAKPLPKFLGIDTLRVPSYIRDFHCHQCAECCLQKWRIDIDQKTYDKVSSQYEKLARTEEFMPLMKKEDNGQISMNFNKGRCQALTDDNLCRFQKELGHDFLSNTCKVYPRHIFVSSRGVEFALTFSCRAAADLLRNKAKITIEELPKDTTEFLFMRPNRSMYYWPERLKERDMKRHYYLLEDGLITVMQNRDYSISDRLLFIGLIVGQLLTWGGHDDIQKRLERIFSDYPSYPLPPADECTHFGIFRQVVNARLQQAGSRTVKNIMAALYQAILKPEYGLPLQTAAILARSEPENILLPPKEYRNKVRRYFPNSLQQSEHILEHYFINYILKKEFYYQDILFAFFRMAFLYALVNVFILGYCVMTGKAADDDILVQAIMDMENNFSHSDQYFQKVRDNLEKQSPDEVLKAALAMAHV